MSSTDEPISRGEEDSIFNSSSDEEVHRFHHHPTHFNEALAKRLKLVEGNNLQGFLKDRKIGSSKAKGLPFNSKQYSFYEEREYDTKLCDKIFASVWLSSTQVIMGSKCNKVSISIFYPSFT
jgi:hypothetical protein